MDIANALTSLRRIAFLLERSGAPTHRVKAFRNAADIVLRRGEDIARRAQTGTLREVPGIGAVTSVVITQATSGEVPDYLRDLEAAVVEVVELSEAGSSLLSLLRGDLHSHSDWSDGGSGIEEMTVTAIELGRDYLALTDHSPRLRVASGLTAERLTDQLAVLTQMRGELGEFTLLSGIEVDILDDGTLDQSPQLLDQLDVVVASVHSKLRMESAAMTARMLAAVSDPHTNVLGHCTGRLLGAATGDDRSAGKGRPPSAFDAAAVFASCADNEVAVEINCRPERLDPPEELLTLARDRGCLFSIDTDAHAPGQLDWLAYGCERAAQAGISPDRVITTWPAERLLDWAGRSR